MLCGNGEVFNEFLWTQILNNRSNYIVQLVAVVDNIVGPIMNSA
jgi:hypothetical protein